MPTPRGIRIVAFCIVTIAGCLYAGTGDTITLSGIIGGVDHDFNGRITTVALLIRLEQPAPATTRRGRVIFEEAKRQYELYTIANTETGRELSALAGETIIATGTVQLDKKGKKNFTVIRYALKKSNGITVKASDTLDLYNE